MRRRPTRSRIASVLLLLAVALACGGETRDAGDRLAPGQERGWTPEDPAGAGEGGAPALPEAARPGRSAPSTPRAEAPPAPPVATPDAAIRRLEARVREAERALEAAREELEAAREALAEAQASATGGPVRGDAELFREVQRRLLQDPALSRVAIRAEVDEGVVTLHGSVADRETARAAGAVAASVDGVVRVESRIEVTAAR